MVGFGRDGARILVHLDDEHRTTQHRIATLASGGATPLAKALELVAKLFCPPVARRPQLSEKIALIASDGRPNRPEEAIAASQALQQLGVRILAFGIGDKLDEEFLRRLCSTPADYYELSELEELPFALQRIVAARM